MSANGGRNTARVGERFRRVEWLADLPSSRRTADINNQLLIYNNPILPQDRLILLIYMYMCERQ